MPEGLGSHPESGGDPSQDSETGAEGGGQEDEQVEGFYPPPELVLKAPSSVAEGELITLDASGSFTPRDKSLSFFWEQESGPTVDLGDETAPVIRVVAPEVDQDTLLRFVVTIDDTVETASEAVEVTVADSIGSASVELGIEAIVGEGGDPMTVRFIGSRVTGDPLPEGRYSWDFGDGETAEGTSVTHTYAEARVYQVLFCTSLGNILSGCTEKQVEIVDAAPLPGGPAPAPVNLSQLTLGPTEGFDSNGIEGGPFDPPSKTYTITNTGAETLRWKAVKTSSRLLLSSTEGILEPEETETVVVSINADDDTLVEGEYTDSLRFVNESNGSGSTERTIKEKVFKSGVLLVTAGEFRSYGVERGPFTPEQKSYTVTNTGEVPVRWSVSASQPWLKLVDLSGNLIDSGNLPAGQSATVIASHTEEASALKAGDYTGEVVFTNDNNGQGNAQRAVSLVVVEPGVMSVSNESLFSTNGTVGGPFDPPSTTYTLTNLGVAAYDWSAGSNASWLTVTPSAGRMPNGGSQVITVSVNGEAVDLRAGVYPAMVVFVNTSNEQTPIVREVELSAEEPLVPVMAVSSGAFVSGGVQGGPFTATKAYTVTNSGNGPMAWSVRYTANWLSVSPSEGTLGAGESETVTASLTAEADTLAAGVYHDVLEFSNDSNAEDAVARSADLTVIAPGELTVTPVAAFAVSGTVGGPFSPLERIYTLSNTGVAAVDWRVEPDVSWLTITQSSGTLSYLATTDVKVELNANANSLPVGVHTGQLRFINVSSDNNDTTLSVNLSVLQDGTVTVSSGDYIAVGVLGGPFTPASKTYTLTNSGSTPKSWGLSHSSNWLTVSPTFGTLDAGQTATIAVSFSAHANSLPVSLYQDELVFTVSGIVHAARRVELNVIEPGRLAVTPSTGLSASGVVGGPFAPSGTSYALQNTGTAGLSWAARANVDWVSVSPSSGSLASGETVYVTVQVDADAAVLTAGVYSGKLELLSGSGLGTTSRDLQLTVAAPAEIRVSEGNLASTGDEGGPFLPSSKTYTITNIGGEPLTWSASSTVNWLALSPTGGTIDPGANQTVTLSYSAEADALVAGTYSGTVIFTNTVNDIGNASRSVALTVDGTGSGSSRVSDGLVVLFDFNEGTGTTVYDRAPGGSPHDLDVANATATNWVPGGLSITSSTIVQSSQAATKLIDACKASHEITLEAWIKPANTSQNGPARVFTLSSDITSRNFTLGQAGTEYEVRLRTSSTSYNGVPALGTSAGAATTTLTHVVYTRAASGAARLYVNGVEQATDTIAGDFSTWDASYALALGNELSLNRPWEGQLHLAAAYGRALSVSEVQQNFVAGPEGDAVDGGRLNVTPSGGLASSGVVGGTFSPASATYTLENIGSEPISWAVSKTATWVSLSSSASGTLEPGASATVTVSIDASGLAPGSLSDILTFTNTTNGAGDTTRDVSVTVKSDEPGELVVDAGADRAVMLPGALAVDATVTQDGSPVASPTPGWTKVSGPGTVAFSDNSDADPTVTFGAAGTYVLRLEAGNGTQTASDDMTAYVLPEITVQASASSGTMPLEVEFKAMEGGALASTVPAGSTFEWNFGDGNMATGTRVVHTYTNAGTFTATLTLTLAGSLGSFVCGQATTQVAYDGSTAVMTTASRTSGVAPLGVFFDCINDPDEPWASGVVQPRGFDAQPTISGVRITRVEYGMPLNNGTLTYSASVKTLRWQASGEASGAAVDVSGGKTFALPSGGGRHLHVWVNPAELPGGNASDTITIVDGGINADWASFHYEWNFGDPAPNGTSATDPRWYWERGAKKSDGSWFAKNRAFGWNAAHVYEDPGTYAVNLTIIDDLGGEHRYSQTVTVTAEPPGGWETFYFSSSEGSDTTGDGSIDKPFATWGKAIAWAGPNTKLLFKRGDTFVVSGAMSPRVTAPFYVGAYGTGERPRFTCSSGVDFMAGNGLADARVVDLWIDGTYPSEVPGGGISGLGDNGLVLRCRVQDMSGGFSFYRGRNSILADSEAEGSKKYNLWVSGNPRCAILGSMSSRGNEEALMRVYTSKLLLGHSTFHTPLVNKYSIRFMASDTADQEGRWYSILRNDMRDVVFSVQGDSDTLAPQHAMIDGNVIGITASNSPTCVEVRGCDDLTVRNNRVHATASHDFVRFIDGYLSWNYHHHHASVYNNTVYYDGTSWIRFLSTSDSVGGNASAWILKGNVLHAPNTTDTTNTRCVRFWSASADGLLESDFNAWYVPHIGMPFKDKDGSYDLSTWRGMGFDQNSIMSNPQLVDPASSRLTIGGNSPCVDYAPSALSMNRVDADGRLRMVDGDSDGTKRSDIGAYEYAP